MANLVTNLGGAAGFGEHDLPANDDGSTGGIDITSIFPNGLSLFGSVYNYIYVNNNGNVTFTQPLSTYTPSAIGSGFTAPIIAPFWADVYTASGSVAATGGGTTGSNLVWYDLDSTDNTITITWDYVGYYTGNDKVNAFQLQIKAEPNGVADVKFIYQTIQWVAGSASGGSDGLGGTPARIGYSAGDGSHYFEIAESGDQAALLTLPTTLGNTGQAGVFEFKSGTSGIYSLASALVTMPQDSVPGPIDFGNVHVGEAAATSLVVTNTAQAPAEALDASLISNNADVTTAGTIALLAAGATDDHSLTVGLDTTTSGAKTSVVTVNLASDGAGTSDGGLTNLAPQTIAVAGNVYAYASPRISTNDVHVAARVGDTPPIGSVTVSNGSSADAYQESLAYQARTPSAGFSIESGGAGTVVSGSSAVIGLQLDTSQAGNFADGTLSVSLTSTGAGTSGLGDTPLSSTALALDGIVYAPAAAQVSTRAIDFGIVHVGDIVSRSVSVSNTGAGAVVDGLTGSFGQITAGFTGSGSLAVAAAGTGSLTVGLDTSHAATYSGSAHLDLQSHDADLADLTLQSPAIDLTGTVDLYAAPVLQASGGALSQDGNHYTLDLGTLLHGEEAQAVDIAVGNAVGGPADALSGTFDIGNAAGFLDSGFTSVADIGAGNSVSAGTVALDTSHPGTASETFTFHPTGSNASGYSGALSDITLTVTGKVTAPSPDLVVSAVDTPSTAVAGRNVPISWTLHNGGDALAAGPWTDEVFIASDAGGDNPQLVGSFTFNGTLAAGASVTRSQIVTVPAAFAGNAYFVVQTDTANQVSENSGEGNNQTIASTPTAVTAPTYPNLTVSSITPPSAAFSGQQTEVSWIVTNTGASATSAPAWTDNIYLSLDRTLDTSDILLASVGNPSYLAAGASYKSTATVTLPPGISGPYYIIVKTDTGNQVVEASGAGSKIAESSSFSVQLTPALVLATQTVFAPSQAFSGQPLTLNWTIANTGAGPTGGSNWTDQVLVSSDGQLDSTAKLVATIGHTGALAPGQSYTGSTTFDLPIGVSGDETFFVVPDADSQVYEIGSPSSHAGSATVHVNLTPPPDLEVAIGAVPSSTITGHALTVSYTVSNQGSTTTPNASWSDSLYISPDPTLDGNATLLGSFGHNGALDPGQSYTASNNFTLPDGLAGQYYVIVETDAGNSVFELDKSNDVATSAPIDIAYNPVDLVVSSVSVPPAAKAGHQVIVDWRVTNTGSGDTTTHSWTDTVVLSASGVLGASDNITLRSVQNARALSAGANYKQSLAVDLPDTLSGPYTLFVVTDPGKSTPESDYTNNASAGQSVAITPLADLRVASVTAPATDTAGDPVTVGWTVTNADTTATETKSWADSVYLVDARGARTYLGQVRHAGSLAGGASYTGSASFTLPTGLATGTYSYLVATDASDQVLESDDTNNAADASTGITALPAGTGGGGTTGGGTGGTTGNGTASTARPDLAVSAVSAPAEVTSGQPVTVSWTLANAGDATDATWYDEVYLSRDQVFDPAADTAIGYLAHTSALASGASQTLTQSFTVPSGYSGLFYVFVSADDTGALNDPNRTNNAASTSAPTEMDLPPTGGPGGSTDLGVGAITVPATASDGGPVSITYTVDNLGSAASTLGWRDAVYLSSDGVWDVNDPLLGTVDHSGGIAAGGSYTATLNATLPGVAAGDYHVIVKTDVYNAQPEADPSNKTGASSGTMSVGVPTLTLGTPVSGSLSTGGTAYYQFTVSAGETVDLSLTSDNGASANDIYVKQGSVPTIGQFDATSATPLLQNPTAVLHETQPGTYYVMVRESAGGTESYTLNAATVPYSITGITPDEGSNLGSVTLTIDGARFNANETVEIIGSDGKIVTADKVLYASSGELWATFDLRGLPVGAYDVKIQDATETATLKDGFTVTGGPAGHLAVSLTAPATVRTHVDPATGLTGIQNGIVTVNYTNDGGTDIAAPILDLNVTNANFQSSATGLVGPSEITIAGISQTGPAGILQPGAQESVSYTFVGHFGYAQFISMQLSLGALTGSSQTIDWNSLEASIKPATIDDADWSLIWNRFEAQVGTTTQSLLDALSRDETTLNQIGQRTSDLGTLLGYELAQAGGALPNTTLTASTDLAQSGTGIDLSLTRAYGAGFDNRNDPGTFGDGWTSTYDIEAVTDSAGNVFITSPSGTESFTLQSDGSFAAATGDTSKLTLHNGTYVLTGAGGAVETFRTDGQLATVTDPDGNTATLSYDSRGIISGVASSNGQSLSFTTNAAGRITSATTGQGQTTTYSYDASGDHLVGVTGPGGTTTYSYEAGADPYTANALTAVTNADGTQQNFTYDSLGDLASQSGTGGAGKLTYGYGSTGTLTETDASGNATRLIYDTNGNLAQIEDAQGHATQLRYDSAGNLTGVVTPGGGTYAFTYDASGNLTGYTDPNGGTVKAAYAPGTGLLVAFTDQDGNTTHYGYDAAGHMTGITYDDGSGTTYQYSSAGALTQSTNARGQTIRYGYDSAGDLTSKTYGDGTSEHFTYDAYGDLTSAEAKDGGTTRYTYNAAGELTSVTDPQGRVESYGYNAGGQEIQRVEPDGSITNYSYTAAGQLAGLADGSGNPLVHYAYNTAGQLTGAAMGNGATTAYAYDSLGNVTSIVTKDATGAVTSHLDYTYDSSGRAVTAASQDGTWTYGYDTAGQLTHAVFASTNTSIPNQDLTYKYDAAGNRIQTILNGAVSNYTTNGLNQYTAVDGTTYDYDADGNLVSKTTGGQTTTYSYDAENQLTSVTGPAGTTTYGYDALGNRVSQTVDGVTSSYVIDPQAIVTSATGPLASIAQVYDAAGTATDTYDYGNGLAAVTTGGATDYYNTDATGNITSLSGAGGSLVDTYDYTPFGTMLAATGSVANPFQYSGNFGIETDTNDLIYMRSRYFDPKTGSFISKDPINLFGGINFYHYSKNNPSNKIDPTGLYSTSNFVLDITRSATQLASDPGSLNWGGVVGAVVGLGVFVVLAPETIPAALLVGALSGALSNGVGQAINISTGQQENDFKYKDFIIDTVAGAVGGGFSRIPGITSGRNSWQAIVLTRITKGDNVGLKSILKALGLLAVNAAPTAIAALIKSIDPNDIVGPASYGPQNFIAAASTDAYTIDFENAATATAPAQDITITQQLDSNLDWRSFRLTGFGFDQQTTTLDGKSPVYSGLIDLSATKGYDVEVTAGVDVSTGLVTWTFQTIDPKTGQTPTDPTLGFLPIDDAAGDGEGFVSYTIKPKSTVPTGTIINAKAQVIFDTNAPIDTPAIFDTIDAVAPTSEVAALPAQTNDTTFEVSWSGQDDAQGSGVASYDILVSEDGGTPTAWLSDTTRANALFTGALGHTYAFSSIATDNAGNQELPHPTADAAIVVGVPAPKGLALTAASDSGASQTDGLTATATPVVTGSATAGATVTLYDGATVVGTSQADTTTGLWTITTAMLADGLHALSAVATNGTGGASAASLPLSVTIDTSAPSVTETLAHDTGASATDKVTSDPSLVGTGEAGAVVSFTVDGTTIPATATTDSTGTWSFTPIGLADGPHTIVASETDAAGNTGTASLTFTLETTTTSTQTLPDGSTKVSTYTNGSLVEAKVTGIPDQIYTSKDTLFASNGKATTITFTKADGSLYATLTYAPDGSYTVAHPGILGQAYTSYTNLYAAHGTLTGTTYDGIAGKPYTAETNIYKPGTTAVDHTTFNYADGSVYAIGRPTADGGYRVDHPGVTGAPYTSLTNIYAAGNIRTGSSAGGYTASAYDTIDTAYAANGTPVFDAFLKAGVVAQTQGFTANGTPLGLVDYTAAGPSGVANAGAFEKRGTTDTWLVDALFNNSGTVDIESGALQLSQGGANTGSITVGAGAEVSSLGALTGSGEVDLRGAGSLFDLGGASSNTFVYKDQSASTLRLDDAGDFTGSIQGFGTTSLLDLGGFGPSSTFVYTENQSATGGLLSVSDGTHHADLAFVGNYAQADFVPPMADPTKTGILIRHV